MEKQSEKMTLFTWFTEIIFWVKTFLSPFLGGLIIGSICYIYINTMAGVYLFWLFLLIGLLGGIYFANRIWKTQGTSNFQSKIMETPDIEYSKDPKAPKR